MNNKNSIRVAHFGYSSNYGGVEAYIMELIKNIDAQFDLVVSSNDIPYSDELCRMGVKINVITPRRESYFRYYRDLFRYFRKNKQVSVVHVHINCCSSLAPLKIARLFGKKCVVHSHSSEIAGGRITHILHRLNKPFLPILSDLRLACSEKAGNYMYSNHSYRIVKNGIDVVKYSYSREKREAFRRELGINDELVIGHIGLFSYIKNQRYLVDIFNEVQKIIPESRLVLIGEGAKKNETEAYAKSLGLDEKVVFTGARRDADFAYSAFDVFAMPSLFEGLPIVAIEAQSSGVSCIFSSRISQEVVINENVKLCPLDNPAQWVADIIEVKDMRIYDTKKVIEAGYDSKNSAKLVYSYYQELVNG